MSRPLRILVVADAKLPVPPPGYGGAERIMALLCEGLAARGHRVTLMAGAGSKDYGRLVTYRWAGKAAYPRRVHAKLDFFARAIVEAARGHDVVLANARIDYLWPLLRLGLPLVYRFGNPIEAEQPDKLRQWARGPLRLISVSDAQREGFAGDDWVTIHNGVDLDRLTYSPDSGDGYLAFLGRLTHNKGVDMAIRVARRAELPLKIAGNISDEPGGRGFFEREVRPHLGDGIEWVGVVDDARKSDFLGRARGLLVPIRWPEPFGLVVAEALACGTPVLATPHGSMPELIRDGVNGFLVADEEEMLLATSRLSKIVRCECRDDARNRFGAQVMTERYEAALRSTSDLTSSREAQ